MRKALLLVVLWLMFHASWSQVQLMLENQPVAINVRQMMPEEILYDLGRSLGVSISYNADLLKIKPITLVADSIPLGQVIDSLFLSKDLKLRLIGNRQLVIYPHVEIPTPPDTCYITLSGTLIDGFTEQKLGRVTVKELQTGLMSISNGDGRFILKLPCGLDRVQLEINAMGYHSLFIEQAASEDLGTLRMKGDYVALKEVYILNVHAEQLMADVFKNTRCNYQDQSTRATSFLREVIMKNGKMVGLSEAVFDVYNYPYTQESKKSRAYLVKGRKFTDFEKQDTLVVKLKGSLRSCLDLDIVRHPPFFFDPETYSQMYTYAFNTVMEYNGRDIYVVDFQHRDGQEGLPFEGKMYIDRELKSLVSIEFEVNKSALKSIENQLIIKRSKDVNARLQKARYYVRYTDVAGKLAMNYASFTSQFRVRKKNSLFPSRYEIISEYVVNNFQLEPIDKIKSKDAFDADKVLMDQPIEYSDTYWKGINYLPIDKPLLESADELRRIFSRE